MDNIKKQQLLDAIFDNPSAAFPAFDWQPNTRAVNRYGVNTSKIHVDEHAVYGRESSDHNPHQTYIKNGSTDKHAIIADENGTSIEIFKAWELLHGEQYPWPSLFELYNIEPPQRDPEQVQREQKRRTDTDNLLSDIRKDFLGSTGAAVRDYLTRPIEQGGRGWNADTLSAMAQYIGVVTNDTARRLSDVTGLNIPANIADTHPFVIFTFAKNDGRLQYVKFRTIDPQAKGGDKWRNPTKGKTGVGRDDVDPFNYNNVSFLSATGSRTLIVVESELCAAHATIAGIKNVIAMRGTDGVKPLFAHRLAASGCTKIVFLYDAEGSTDKQKQTNDKLLRAIKGLREHADKLSVNVATIPADLNAKDPDELLSRHPIDGAAILQNIIDTAPTATQWQAAQLATQYNNATTDEERRQIEIDTVNQSAELKTIGGTMAIEGDRLTAIFCTLSGTVITAETMAQAANEKALQTARDKFNKTRDGLLSEYDTARKQGNDDKAADILNRIHHLTKPQADPELNQRGKSFDDIARELYVDETANIVTSYQVNTKDRTGRYTPHPVTLPANGITYIAGGTGHGKSTMLQNIAYDLLKRGKRVLYYGFEEMKRDTLFEFVNIMIHDKRPELLELSRDGSAQAINRYLHDQKTDVFNGRYFVGGYGEYSGYHDIPPTYQQTIADIIKGFFNQYRGMDGGQQTLFVYDDTFTSSELVDHIARVAPVARPDAIFIDYIQFLQAEPNNQRAAKTEDLGKVSKDLITINKTHNIPVIVAAQLKEKNNAKAENYPDTLNYTDIEWAGSIAQGAAAVYIIAKATRYPDDCTVTYCGQDNTPFGKLPYMWMKCVKNRFGEDGGQAIYTFDGAKRFIDPASLVEPDTAQNTPKTTPTKQANNNNNDDWEN
ncbi:MAG: hypothetical protein IIW86_04105 [Clostridia bacterium]|nr:hypothetical protein [Clostridia bacterium]